MDAVDKAAFIAEVMDDVCAEADARFAGTNARFALVVWVDGRPAPAEAVAIAVDPAGRSELAQALSSAADWVAREVTN